MQLHTYLNFNGQCEEAFQFYKSIFGGDILFMMRNSDSPMAKDMPAERLNRVMHARIMIAGQIVMGSDVQEDCAEKPQGFSVTINTPDPAEAERVFNALNVGAEVRMPLEETFWAVRFGMLIDRFGIPWMVNCERPMPA
ncbi:hypothetical protein hmeg3_07365 [Herbaspirillum sp. meg3]|uniref:VOC family protein n=1 Tax=Herbaspirillum sp. meg3 TaxID=2025949 RepID=UPI000B99B7DB|nr:VOC family protein [Herbaspirillum sp. meg3]ASU38136.1 hypothetical protein hmeg3_07365 [Herbaspirillum sp. meg3]